MTALLGTSFDYVMKTACTQTITILYKYFYIWELDFRLNNIINFYLFIIDICIDFHYHCYYYWTSESLLNLWKCTQDSDITNKWVFYLEVH